MFAGKVVLVTGGTSGIGLALARAFLAAGARVTVCGRDPRRLEAARASLPGATASRCDVTDVGQVRRLLAEVEAGFGRLDVWSATPAASPSATSRPGSIRPRSSARCG